MSGTRSGGLRAAETNRLKNPNFYRDIGSAGGKVRAPRKGFGSMPREKVSAAGRKGGLASRRGSKQVLEDRLATATIPRPNLLHRMFRKV